MKDNIENLIGVLIGALGILAIMSIFEDDNSKIVSRKGKKILSDQDQMRDINQKILDSDTENQYNEVFI